MCGILACFGEHDPKQLKRMLSLIDHRGPESNGVYDDSSVWLGHNRLAIQDLTPAGHQPMEDGSGRYVLIFNGEIYNAPELRLELNKNFRSTSDTEVIVEGFAAWGDAIWQRLNGVFACILYDKQEKTLRACRDPLGVKPIYAWKKDSLYLSSEYKAFLDHEEAPKNINHKAVERILTYRYNPTNDTLLKDVELLEPGIIFSYSRKGIEKKSFWSFEEQHKKASAESLKKQLKEAVNAQLLSDVPIALLLSGGLDSAAIGAFGKQAGYNFSTFTIAYDDPRLEDAKYARQLAEFWGFNHTEVHLDENSLGKLPETIYHMDDVVADPSSIPQLALAEAVHKTHKVVLTGAGGDELFGGYTHHKLLSLQPLLRKRLIGKPISLITRLLPARALGLMSSYAASLGEEGVRALSKAIANAGDAGKFYKEIVQMSGEETRAQLFGSNRQAINGTDEHLKNFALPKDITKIEVQTFLGHDVLMQADKIFMSKSVEARVPLLNLPLVRTALGMPFSQKADFMNTKKLFRKSLEGIPKNILRRGKQGFFVPIDRFKEQLQSFINDIDNISWSELGIKRDVLMRLFDDWNKSPLACARTAYTVAHLGLWHKIFIQSSEASNSWRRL